MTKTCYREIHLFTVNMWILRLFSISDSGPRFVPTAQVLLSENRGICLNGKTHSYRNLLAQFNAMERFSIPEFGNVKWKSEHSCDTAKPYKTKQCA